MPQMRIFEMEGQGRPPTMSDKTKENSMKRKQRPAIIQAITPTSEWAIKSLIYMGIWWVLVFARLNLGFPFSLKFPTWGGAVDNSPQVLEELPLTGKKR